MVLPAAKVVCLPAEAKEHPQSSDGGARQEKEGKSRSVRDSAVRTQLMHSFEIIVTNVCHITFVMTTDKTQLHEIKTRNAEYGH